MSPNRSFLTRVLPLLIAICGTSAIGGCTDSTSVEERKMVLSPRQVVFVRGVDSMTVSITHTCTCPFQWNTTTEPIAVDWLSITAQGSADNASVPIKIDRAKLSGDSTRALVRVRSNYGTDSIAVLVLK